MHLVFRLAGPRLRLFSTADDLVGTTIGEPVVGGARSSYYIKETGLPVLTVGAQLRPGAALALFGVSAAELAGAHTPLSMLWGANGDSALNQLADAGRAGAGGGPMAQLAALDALLCARLPQLRGLHPQVAQALGEFTLGLRIETLVERSDYSHRAFNALFKEAVGLSPKRYARLLRFQAMLARLNAPPGLDRGPAPALIDLALAAGYSDQAHMQREFREFSGVTPTQYRLLAPASSNHLPVAGGRPQPGKENF